MILQSTELKGLQAEDVLRDKINVVCYSEICIPTWTLYQQIAV